MQIPASHRALALSTLAMFGAAASPPSAGQEAGHGTPLTAAQSDPRTMGWMEGSPPPPDRRIT